MLLLVRLNFDICIHDLFKQANDHLESQSWKELLVKKRKQEEEKKKKSGGKRKRFA